IEQVVAEGLQAFGAGRLHRQQRDDEVQTVQARIGVQKLRRLEVCQTREIDGRADGQRDATLLIQPVRIALPDAVATVGEQLESLRVWRCDLRARKQVRLRQ